MKPYDRIKGEANKRQSTYPALLRTNNTNRSTRGIHLATIAQKEGKQTRAVLKDAPPPSPPGLPKK